MKESYDYMEQKPSKQELRGIEEVYGLIFKCESGGVFLQVFEDMKSVVISIVISHNRGKS